MISIEKLIYFFITQCPTVNFDPFKNVIFLKKEKYIKMTKS